MRLRKRVSLFLILCVLQPSGVSAQAWAGAPVVASSRVAWSEQALSERLMSIRTAPFLTIWLALARLGRSLHPYRDPMHLSPDDLLSRLGVTGIEDETLRSTILYLGRATMYLLPYYPDAATNFFERLQPAHVYTWTSVWSDRESVEGEMLGNGGLIVGDLNPVSAESHRVVQEEPGQGGIRFHIKVWFQKLWSLALDMVIKRILHRNKVGGAKGGTQTDVSKKQPPQIARTMRSYVDGYMTTGWELSGRTDIPVRFHKDVLAPDVGTSDRLNRINYMDVARDEWLHWLVRHGIHEVEGVRLPDEIFGVDPAARANGTALPFLRAYYAVVHRETDALRKRNLRQTITVCTGISNEFDGIEGREEATGRGIVLTGLEAMKAAGFLTKDAKDFRSPTLWRRLTGRGTATAALQGLGNVGGGVVSTADERGLVIQIVSEVDANGKGYALYRRNGFTKAVLDQMLAEMGPYHRDWANIETTHPALARKLRIHRLASMDQFWSLATTFKIPAAREDVVDEHVASIMQSEFNLEGANGATTFLAHLILLARAVFSLADIFSNALGVTASYFNKKQSELGVHYQLPEVREMLWEKVRTNLPIVMQVMKAFDVSFRDAAYILGAAEFHEIPLLEDLEKITQQRVSRVKNGLPLMIIPEQQVARIAA